MPVTTIEIACFEYVLASVLNLIAPFECIANASELPVKHTTSKRAAVNSEIAIFSALLIYFLGLYCKNNDFWRILIIDMLQSN
ncbi:hypothetical protein QKW52_11690 [Bacillus sonorensis]|nr:hypothetical protein [Bacillus sonorensis]